MPKIMNKVERDIVAKRVATFYKKNGSNSSSTYQHFMAEGICKSTITRTLTRLRKTGNPITRSPTGRPMKKANMKAMSKIKKLLNAKPSISLRKGCSKVKIPKSTYIRIVKKKLGLKTYKKQTVPKYINNQKSRAKKGCAKIYRNLCGKNANDVLIIDDETYVFQDSEQIKSQKYYRCKSKNDVPNEERFKTKQKFPKKYMVWQAIDSNGLVSDPFIFEGTMTSEIYLEHCLKKILIPFIHKNYPENNVLFWPDLASAHYGDICISYLEEQNVKFVKKEDNPPNMPQARPIERFWSICKQSYSDLKKSPKNFQSFKRIWKKISVEIAKKHGESLMRNVKQKLRNIGRNGVYATFK
jgi:transposase